MGERGDRMKAAEELLKRLVAHRHYSEPPFACARCGCERYRPATVLRLGKYVAALLLLTLTGCASAARPMTDIEQQTQQCYHMGGHVHTDGHGGIICTFPRTY